MVEKDIDLFLKEKNVLPCIIKFDSNGKIERNDHSLEEIPINKIKSIKEEKTIIQNEENEGDFEYKQSIGQASDLSIYYNDAMYRFNVTNYKKKKTKSISEIIKKIVYTCSAKMEDIKLTPALIKEFNEIADTKCDDKEKAKKLDKIFKKIGYFIPLKVYIGGVYILKNEAVSIEGKNNLNNKIFAKMYDDNEDEEESNDKEKNKKAIVKKKKEDKVKDVQIKFGKQSELNDDIKEKNLKHNIVIIGGDQSLKDYKKWENSLNISNLQIIDYANTMEIYQFFDSDLKKKLEKPIEMVEEKYEIRQKYIEKIKELQENKDNNKNLKGDYKGNDWESGITEEMEKPKIYSKFYERKSDGSWFGRIELSLKENFEDVIVGYKIKSRWRDGTNGWWELNENPILTKNIEITFTSQIFRGERFDITIY